MYKRRLSNQFKKDFKRFRFNKRAVFEFEKIVNILVKWEILPEKYLNHKLKWDHKWCFECHIFPDILLVYQINNDELILHLLRIWSHSEIF